MQDFIFISYRNRVCVHTDSSFNDNSRELNTQKCNYTSTVSACKPHKCIRSFAHNAGNTRKLLKIFVKVYHIQKEKCDFQLPCLWVICHCPVI